MLCFKTFSKRENWLNCHQTNSVALVDQRVAKVPPQLYQALTFGHSWSLGKDGYAYSCWNGSNKFLHKAVMQMLHPFAQVPPGHSIDHIDMDRLNNHEGNLRYASNAVQASNKKKRPGALSQYRGVSKRYKPLTKPWEARFRHDKVDYRLGYFKTEEEAYQAVQKRKAELHIMY